nr:MAG TPA: Major capsid protein [Microviridae sp.]
MNLNVSLGFSSKKYTHDMSRDCNTTFSFGAIQPIFSQYMLPDSDISVSAKQLVRLSPLIAPSFARVYLKTVTRFVPEHDVVPFADAFYSKTVYGTTIPSKMPYTNNSALLCLVLCFSNFTCYPSNSLTPVSSSKAEAAFKELYTYSGIVSLGTPNYLTSSTSLQPIPTPQGADFVYKTKDSNLILCFNFGSKAKRLRSILLGLGYSLEYTDTTPVRFAPILAFYKAYFDSFGIKRFKNFTQTVCFSLIKSIQDSNSVSFIDGLYNFMNELSDCFYLSPQDFISIHRSTLQINDQKPTTVNVPINSSGGFTTIVSDKDVDPRLNTTDAGSNLVKFFNLPMLQVLQRLSRFTNKNSILGQRLSSFMKLHFGTSDISSVFEDSNFVDSSSLPCQINDVFSTTDNFDGNDSGEVLGGYAGKGLGEGSLSFKFHAPCHGYLITLAAIVPVSGYFQGSSADLFALDWEDQPSVEFDAVGMEATPRSAFITHNDICDASNASVLADLPKKSFGFVPRFSGFKFAKNIVNGDMSRRGSIDSLSPYYLDRIFGSCEVIPAVSSTSSPTFTFSPIPSASDDFRYISKYPWLGNYNRIFVNETLNASYGTNYATSSSSKALVDLYCFDDPFLSQSVFSVKVRNFLKPMSLSYDTFEESTDNASSDNPVA